MKKEVTFEIDYPDIKLTEAECREWIEYHLQIRGDFDLDNPLQDYEWSDLKPSCLFIK